MQFRESRLIKRGNRRSWYKPPTDKFGASLARLCLNELLQLRVLRLGLLQNGDVGVGVFPEGEEVVVGDFCLGGVALQHIRATEAKMGKRATGNSRTIPG